MHMMENRKIIKAQPALAADLAFGLLKTQELASKVEAVK
jgi:hypothetical protein